MELSIWIQRQGCGLRYRLLPNGCIPDTFFQENRVYDCEIELTGAPLPAQLELAFNGVLADHLIVKGKHVFRFAPGQYAGEVSIALFSASRLLTVVEQTISPAQSKLNHDDYITLLQELGDATSALYRLSGVTVPARGSATASRNVLITLELIRGEFERWNRGVSRIADQPLRALGTVSERVDVLRSRGLRDRSFAAAFRRGSMRSASYAEFQAAPALVKALQGQWVPEIAQERRQEHTAVYENQAILGFARWLLTVLANARVTLGAEEPTAMVLIWLARISRWRAQVLALLRRDIFIGLRPESNLRSTSAFRLHPEYSATFGAMTRMRRGLGAGAILLPAVPIDRTYQLYELWCYVRLLEAAAKRFPMSVPCIHRLLQGLTSPDQLGVVLAQGEASKIKLTGDLSLTYQRRFTAKPDAEGCETLLIEAVPDVVLSRTLSTGSASGLVILDPKYRSGPSLLDGVRDLHVYRDSILHGGARVIAAAAVLAPRPSSPDALPLRSDRPVIICARPGGSPATFDGILIAAEAALA